jgi:L-threonylcarbamoyladenylate synthase
MGAILSSTAAALDSREGHVAGGAAGLLLPLFEKAPIAHGRQRRRIEPKLRSDAIDPIFRAFELSKGADRRLIQNAMAGRVGVFSAPLLINEDRLIAKLYEDCTQSIAVCDFGFGFDAALVAGAGIVIRRQAFVSEHPQVSIFSYAKNRLPGAQSAVRSVVQRIALEGPRCNGTKTENAKLLFQLLDVFNCELDFDLDGAHAPSIRRLWAIIRTRISGIERMQTLRLFVDANNPDSVFSRPAIEQAAQILRAGGTVAFPTETVYGLGANALDAAAVAKIFAAKQRPGWDPLIVHLADRSMLPSITWDICENAAKLMDAFWPGPLTLLLPRSASIPDAVTAGRPLVGVRVPQHPIAHRLLLAAGVPLAAPSANSFGRTSPTLAAHVAEDLDGKIDAILDSGETTHGLESTVVDPCADPCVVYRPGVVTLDQIRTICPAAVPFHEPALRSNAQPQSLPSPGVGLRHYAPRAHLILVDGEGAGQRERFIAELRSAGRTGEKLGLMLPEAFQVDDVGCDALIYRWGAWSNEEELAHRLFAGLRWLDAEGATVILCPLPEAKGVGVAIRDRLMKAARK